MCIFFKNSLPVPLAPTHISFAPMQKCANTKWSNSHMDLLFTCLKSVHGNLNLSHILANLVLRFTADKIAADKSCQGYKFNVLIIKKLQNYKNYLQNACF